MTLVLLTGATGFVGRQVLRALATSGVRVRVVVRSGSQARLAHSASIENVVFTQDLFSESDSWWQTTCSGVDTIAHVAWYAEPGSYLQSPQNALCLEGTLRLARGALAAGVERFVGVGTCFEYDLTQGELGIDTPLRPTTPYGEAKATAFRSLTDLFARQNTSFAWCRLFYLYGDGEDERRLAPYLHRCLAAGEPADLTSGEQVRDYLDVTESGGLIAAVALSNQNGPVNICSGVPTTVRQFAERIADLYGRRDLLRFGTRPISATDPLKVLGTNPFKIATRP